MADLVEEWSAAGLDGFRLRPAGVPADTERIAADLVPVLRRRSLFPETPRAGTLRDRFGWSRPGNRHAVAEAAP